MAMPSKIFCGSATEPHVEDVEGERDREARHRDPDRLPSVGSGSLRRVHERPDEREDQQPEEEESDGRPEEQEARQIHHGVTANDAWSVTG
jgi:hypothetical protein